MQGFALLDDEGRDAGGDAVVDDPAVGQDGRNQGGPALEHQVDDLLVAAVTVLDRVDARQDRVADPDPALGVGGDGHLALVCLLHRGGHLLDGQLRLAGLPARRHHPAGRHQLDRGRAAPEVLAGGAADGVRAVRLPADPPAVPAGHRDDPAARQHVRPVDLAGGDELCELDRHLARSADVADRGHPGAHGRLEAGDAAHEGLAPVLAVEDGLRVRPSVQAGVGVRVHQPRREPPPTKGDDRGARRPVGRRVQSLADRRDPARPDQHVDRARSRPSSVDDPRVLQEEVGHTRSLAQRPLRVAPDPP